MEVSAHVSLTRQIKQKPENTAFLMFELNSCSHTHIHIHRQKEKEREREYLLICI